MTGLIKQQNFGTNRKVEAVVYRETHLAFTSSNNNWFPELEYNVAFVRGIVNYLHIVAKTKGHLFLNDALAEFGFEKTRAGQIAGWLLEDGEVDITHDLEDGQLWVRFRPQGVILDRVFDNN